MSMRSFPKKRTTAKERELTERIRELEEKLAASVPRIEFETVKSNLQSEISDLKSKLSVAECQSSHAEPSKPVTEGQLDEDGFEEREAEDLMAEITPIGSSSERLPTEDTGEPETKESEDEEDSEEP